jgi:hypothetical protein
MSDTPVWRPTFADTVRQGDSLATDADGNEPYKVVTEPLHTKNFIGNRRYVTFVVQLLHAAADTDITGRMTYAPSDIVFRRTS